jgi:hypothetical protein
MSKKPIKRRFFITCKKVHKSLKKMFDNHRGGLYKAALCNANALKTKRKTLLDLPARRLRLKRLGLDRE